MLPGPASGLGGSGGRGRCRLAVLSGTEAQTECARPGRGDDTPPTAPRSPGRWRTGEADDRHRTGPHASVVYFRYCPSIPTRSTEGAVLCSMPLHMPGLCRRLWDAGYPPVAGGRTLIAGGEAGCCARLPAGLGSCFQASERRRRKKTSWTRYSRAGKGLASDSRSRAERVRRSHATPNQVR